MGTHGKENRVEEKDQEYLHPAMRGVAAAYPRSMYRCCGYTDEELRRPLIGVVTSFFEAHPGSRALQEQAAAVKAGIWMGGGTPVEFHTIAVCDAIAQGPGMHYGIALSEPFPLRSALRSYPESFNTCFQF